MTLRSACPCAFVCRLCVVGTLLPAARPLILNRMCTVAGKRHTLKPYTGYTYVEGREGSRFKAVQGSRIWNSFQGFTHGVALDAMDFLYCR